VMELDIGKVLELPAGAARRYVMRSVWGGDGIGLPGPQVRGTWGTRRLLVAGRAASFHLGAFEVLTLEGVPQR